MRAFRDAYKFFDELVGSKDAMQCLAFPDETSEAEWVAAEIVRNLEHDGLSERDILIVSANPFLDKKGALLLIKTLTRHRVRIHFAGSDGRVDELFGAEGSVPISGIRRAKGNEAPMVYVVHAEHGADQRSIIRRRNALFSAITRSRAWVRITGSGEGMQAVHAEVQRVVENDYRLRFVVPSARELAGIRKLRRDATPILRRRGRSRLS